MTHRHIAFSKPIIILEVNPVEGICVAKAIINIITTRSLQRSLKNRLHVVLCATGAHSDGVDFIPAFIGTQKVIIEGLINNEVLVFGSRKRVVKLHLGRLGRLDDLDAVDIVVVAYAKGVFDLDIGVSLRCCLFTIDNEFATVVSSAVYRVVDLAFRFSLKMIDDNMV